MQAETVYNVAMALPETERLRLVHMLQKELQPAEPKKEKVSAVWTHQECYDQVLRLLMDRKRKQYGSTKAAMTVVK